LRKQLEEEKNEKDSLWNYAAELEENTQRMERDRFSLRIQLDAMRASRGAASKNEITIPTSPDEMDEWQQHVAGQMWIAPRALGAARKSEFQDPPLVYRALLLLANEYREMRIHGGEQYKQAYQDGRKELRCNQARSISQSRVGEHGDEYYVNYPFQQHKRVFLDEHLRRGNDRDHRNTLRIYFAWEPQEQIVIVGWLPGHLTTRLS
jgi:hypothetical protein